MNTGKCPKCNAAISTVKAERVRLSGAGLAFKTFSCLCPSCSVVLGVQIDSYSLQADAVSQILKAVGKD